MLRRSTLGLLAGSILLLGAGCGESKRGGALPNEAAVHELNGTDLFVRVIGSGEPIVVLHGGPGLDHGYFLPQFESLAEDHTLIFFDQRASGKSGADFDSTGISIDLFIKDIDAVREHYGLETMNLMGHSWGGFLAMLYAIRHPERLETLILASPSPASSAMRNQESASLAERVSDEDRAVRDSIVQSEAFQRGDSKAYEEFFRVFFRGELFQPARIDELNLSLPETFVANSMLLRFLARDLAVYDLHQDLARVEVPALVINGESETGVESGRRISEALPQAEYVLLTECGHFSFIECPDAFFGAIRAFVAAN